MGVVAKIFAHDYTYNPTIILYKNPRSAPGGHRDAFLNKSHKAPCILIGLLSRPPSLKRSERRGLFFVMPVDSLVVDSTFKQSENIAIAVVNLRLFKVLLLTCIEGCGLHNITCRFIVCAASSVHAHCRLSNRPTLSGTVLLSEKLSRVPH